MSITRPTLPQLVDRAETDLCGRLLEGATALRRSVINVLARVFAAIVLIEALSLVGNYY